MTAVGFEVGAELVGFFEAEHELACAGWGPEDRVEFGEEFGVRAVQRDADAEGFGELDLDVFECVMALMASLGAASSSPRRLPRTEDGDIDLEFFG